MRTASNLSTETHLAYRVGRAFALVTTASGVIYFLVVAGTFITNGLAFPPPDAVQVYGGIISLLVCPAIVIMMGCLHAVTPPSKQVLSLVSLGFCFLFALAVSINRFSQLGPVRLAEAAGRTEGIAWFQAYGDYSIMLGLEYLGWAWFLGLAMLSAAPVFSGSRLTSWIRWLMVVYGFLGLTSSVGYLLGNTLALLGFVAWGLVLFVITGLLVIYFHAGTAVKRGKEWLALD
jgi:hypothetical protein